MDKLGWASKLNFRRRWILGFIPGPIRSFDAIA